MMQMAEEGSLADDGKQVKYVGIITSLKKKYTKRNTLMAFMTVEDLYGSTEIIVFDSCYSKSQNILLDENIVVIEGRLSIREDEAVKIVANNITEFNENIDIQEGKTVENEQLKVNTRPKMLTLNISNADEMQKDKLRGAIRFFTGDRNNIAVQVNDSGVLKPCGAIYINEEILEQFKEILGKENVEAK